MIQKNKSKSLTCFAVALATAELPSLAWEPSLLCFAQPLLVLLLAGKLLRSRRISWLCSIPSRRRFPTDQLTLRGARRVSAGNRRRLLASSDLAKHERPDPKPSLDAVMSQAQIEKKVEDYLRNSQALEDYWQRPITAEQLQAEMERMASTPNSPKSCGNCLKRSGTIPLSSRSVWPGRSWRSV